MEFWMDQFFFSQKEEKEEIEMSTITKEQCTFKEVKQNKNIIDIFEN